MATFAVVEFADDNSVEIIPTTWLEETIKVCFYSLNFKITLHLHSFI